MSYAGTIADSGEEVKGWGRRTVSVLAVTDTANT